MGKKGAHEESKALKTKSISIRMTAAEMDKVDQFAAEFNLPTGMYIRLCALLGYLPYAVTRSGPTVPGAQKVENVKEIAPPAGQRVGSVKEISSKRESAHGPSQRRSHQG